MNSDATQRVPPIRELRYAREGECNRAANIAPRMRLPLPLRSLLRKEFGGMFVKSSGLRDCHAASLLAKTVVGFLFSSHLRSGSDARNDNGEGNGSFCMLAIRTR